MRRAGPAVLAVLLAGLLVLAFGVAGGLARFTPWLEMPRVAIALHGPLLVSAFLGALIALELALSSSRAWALAAPLAAALGGLLLVAGFPGSALLTMTAGAAAHGVGAGVRFARQVTLDAGARLAAALAWLAGHLLLFAGLPAVPWWIAFVAVAFAGQRLSSAGEAGRREAVRQIFLVLVGALLVAPLEPRAMGAILVLLAAWLFALDVALLVAAKGKDRYSGACFIAGDLWLGLGGALIALSMGYDAALHAIFVGFAFSVLFGRAAQLTGVLRKRPSYAPLLYVPLALLHVSLVARALGGILPEGSALFAAGAWGNAGAMLLFVATLVFATWSARR